MFELTLVPMCMKSALTVSNNGSHMHVAPTLKDMDPPPHPHVGSMHETQEIYMKNVFWRNLHIYSLFIVNNGALIERLAF